MIVVFAAMNRSTNKQTGLMPKCLCCRMLIISIRPQLKLAENTSFLLTFFNFELCSISVIYVLF